MRARFLLPILLGLLTASAQIGQSPTPPRTSPPIERQPGAPPGQRRPDVPIRGCPDGFVQHFEVGPQTRGPLRLEEVICAGVQNRDAGTLLLSPDGRAVAHWGSGREPVLEAVPLDGSPGMAFANPTSGVFRTFMSLDLMGRGGFAWARDSQGLWTVRQLSVIPSGFALGPLEPIRVGRDGEARALPRLSHAAGPLDAIEWIGGDGLALAQFGTRGGYYRPEHADPSPTLAMVDARRGRVLAALSALRIPQIRDRLLVWGFRPSAAAGVVLPDGRLRAVLLFPRWNDIRSRRGTEDPPMRPGQLLMWTQGEAPHVLPVPDGTMEHSRINLSPDGRRLLSTWPIQPSGMIVEHRPSPPPEPVTGVAAELLDAETGRSLWRIEARAEQWWNGPATPSAISPDGRLGLLALPPDGDDYMNYVLVELRSGRIIQRLKPLHTWTYAQTFGFTADGRRVWLTSGNVVIFYRRAPL